MGQVRAGGGKPWYDEAAYHGAARDTSAPVKQKMFFWEVAVHAE